jgi:TOBE domain
LKAQPGSLQTGDEIDGRGTRTCPVAVAHGRRFRAELKIIAASSPWKGAPLRICAWKRPLDPTASTVWCAVPCANSFAIFCIGVLKLAATTTGNSAAPGGTQPQAQPRHRNSLQCTPRYSSTQERNASTVRAALFIAAIARPACAGGPATIGTMIRKKELALSDVLARTDRQADGTSPGRAAVALRTSMRNPFPCTVDAVLPHQGQVRVRLRMADSEAIHARITRENVQLLGPPPCVCHPSH